MRNAALLALMATALGGCGMGPEYTTAPLYAPQPAAIVQPAAAAVYANPILLPIANSQCAWEQVVDVIDDYFRIEHEEPIRPVGNLLTEGSITTVPEVSPTIFEPWRHDTVDPDERLENTLQTMRRRAVVRVIPTPGGYNVDVQVFKELENMAKPEHATAGAATFRYDSTLSGIIDPITGQQATLGWIPRGRDTSLEQCIISDLMSRCAPCSTGQSPRGRGG